MMTFCQKVRLIVVVQLIPIIKNIATIMILIWNYVGAIRESPLLLHDFLEMI
jgi:hypothetical protein